MKAKLASIIATLAVLGGLFALAVPAMAYPPSDMTMTSNANDTMTSGMPMMSMWDDSKKIGMISSIQNDESGQPGWLVSGHFMMELDNSTSGVATNVTDFYAAFQMIMLNGSAGHSHEIYNFTSQQGTESGNTTTIRGISTVTMREGPVNDVGTEITIANDKVISISLDPSALDNHFGNTPIYGLVITPDIFQHMMNTTTSSTMMDGMYKHGNRTGTAIAEEWK